MKYKLEFLISMMAALLFFYCGQPEKSPGDVEEVVLVQPESARVEIQLPELHWKKTLVILPLSVRQQTSDTRNLSSFITDRLYGKLTHLTHVRVLSPSYMKKLGVRDCDADYVLKGELGYDGSQVMVTLRLTDVRKDTNLWAGSYIEPLASILSIEEGALKGVQKSLGIASDKISVKHTQPIQEEAMAFYIEGKGHHMERTLDHTNKAVHFYKQALHMDSTFTLAWIDLAKCYLQIYQRGWNQNLVWIQLAQQAGQKVIQLNQDCAEGFLIMGECYMAFGDWKQAEMAFRKALVINSNLNRAWAGLGNTFIQYGLYKPSLRMFENVMALSPDDTSVCLSAAMIRIGMGDYHKAEEIVQRAIQLYPGRKHYVSFLALIRYYQDEMDEAMDHVQEGLKSEVNSPFSHAVLSMIYAKQGKLDESLGEVELYVKPYIGNDGALATAVAAVYGLLGQKGQAIQWLEKAISWGYKEYPWLITDPNFRELRQDDRFGQLMDSLKIIYENNLKSYSDSQVTL